ncbi:ABC-three component system protein [Agrobacterium cavarae]|uniref:ABC-three component system protein n=1 Tax=Agrobacterium cavarae TaxID=2528239 RepID=UPI0028A9437F|nr:ABC-three component system protein [Agrobacterium cavarae]
METTRSNQSKSIVYGDQGGRDVIKHYHSHGGSSQVSSWLKRLEAQIESENKDLHNQFVQSLQFFIDRRDEVDVVGLKDKIERSRFKIDYYSALKKKEEFAKLLLRFQEFSSAQELFAYFLSIIYDVFEEKICPYIETLDYIDIQKVIDGEIITKIFTEIGEGSDVVLINRNHVRGMIYWLADKCYVRWH